jgi:hypothetical protein
MPVNHYVLNIYSLHNYQHLNLALLSHLDVQHIYQFSDVDKLHRNTATQICKMKKVWEKAKAGDSMPSDAEDGGGVSVAALPSFQQNVTKPKPRKVNTQSQAPKDLVVATGNVEPTPTQSSAMNPATTPRIPFHPIQVELVPAMGVPLITSRNLSIPSAGLAGRVLNPPYPLLGHMVLQGPPPELYPPAAAGYRMPNGCQNRNEPEPRAGQGYTPGPFGLYSDPYP